MFRSGALHIGGIRLSLDDALQETCFVSHAHSDHTSAFFKKRKIIASEETFVLMGKEPSSHQLKQVSLHAAGHMLGARQLAAECDGERFVYTGDFALHDSYTAQSAPILPCDTLMIDSTYCLPNFRFPSRQQALSRMEKFVKKNGQAIVVFGAYVRGKTQELVKFLNTECSVAPIVGAPAAKICSFYEKCGVKLDYIAAGTEEAEEQMRSAFVAVMPSSMVNFGFGSKLSEAFGREVKTAVATGWAHVTRFPVDESFALSDHADFRDTMRYIHESGAKKVVCANSSEREAAEYLRSIGINATAKQDAMRELQATLAQTR